MAKTENQRKFLEFAQYLCAIDGEEGDTDARQQGRVLWKHGRKRGNSKNAAAGIPWAEGDDPVKLAKAIETQFGSLSREYPRLYLTAYLTGQSGNPYHWEPDAFDTDHFETDDDNEDHYQAPSLSLNDPTALLGAFAHTIERQSRHQLNANRDLTQAVIALATENGQLQGQIAGWETVVQAVERNESNERMAAAIESLGSVAEKVAPSMVAAWASHAAKTAAAEKAKTPGAAPEVEPTEPTMSDLMDRGEATLQAIGVRYGVAPGEADDDLIARLRAMHDQIGNALTMIDALRQDAA